MAWALVKHQNIGAAGDPINDTFTGTTNGNLIVVLCSGDQAINSITVGGQTCTLGTEAAGADHTRMGWVVLTSGGDKTITVDFPASSNCSISTTEWSGNDASPFDAEGAATGAAGDPIISLLCTADNDLIVAVSGSSTGDPATGAGYTGLAMATASNFCNGEYDLDVGSAGVNHARFIVGGNWSICGMAFKQSGAVADDGTASQIAHRHPAKYT